MGDPYYKRIVPDGVISEAAVPLLPGFYSRSHSGGPPASFHLETTSS